MATNVEIKARARDFDGQMARAAELAATPRELISQVDIFYESPAGRLKLRLFSETRGELIFYRRADQDGPKISAYERYPTEDAQTLKRVLDLSLPVRGVVRKRRWLYLCGQTRIHLDEVEGLGRFLELEAVMRPGQDPAEGEEIARGLMAELGVEPEDLIDRAYVDLLADQRAVNDQTPC